MSIDFLTSWETAERECFEAIRNVCGGAENAQAFIGYLPEAAPNVWAFSSGGSAETQIERLQGDNPCFSILRFNAHAFGQFDTRENAQQFACGVLRTLSDTGNMKNTGNVYWLRLVGMPSEPALELSQISGYYMWTVDIPMEMVFSTSTNYQEN